VLHCGCCGCDCCSEQLPMMKMRVKMKYDDVWNARYGDRLHDAEGIYHSPCLDGPKSHQHLNHVQFRDFYVSFFPVHIVFEGPNGKVD